MNRRTVAVCCVVAVVVASGVGYVLGRGRCAPAAEKERVAEKSATTETAKAATVENWHASLFSALAGQQWQQRDAWRKETRYRRDGSVASVSESGSTTRSGATSQATTAATSGGAKQSATETAKTAQTERLSERLVLREGRPRWSLGAGPSWNSLTLRPTGAVVTGGVRVAGPLWLKAQGGYDNGVRGALLLEVTW